MIMIMMITMTVTMTISVMRNTFVWFFAAYFICVDGYTFRHMLASLHLKENLYRDTQLTKHDEKYFKVTYPKYKLGEEVVREVASPPTHCEFNYSTG